MRRDTSPEPSRALVERFHEKTALAPVAAEILWQANRAEDAEAFLACDPADHRHGHPK